MEVIRSKRGGLKLCYEGFMYTKKHEAKNLDQITWRCVEREPPRKCLAILRTTKANEQPDLMKEHNHPPNETKVGVAKIRHDMKSRAQTTRDKPNQLFTFALTEASDEVKTHLPQADTCKRVLRRARAAHCPADPQTLDELIIDGIWATTGGDNPLQFLLHDSGAGNDERVVIFASENHLRKLAASVTWCMDGNYAMAPRIFMQLYVIHGRVSGTFVPLAYALLQRKTQSCYETMLQILEERGCDPSVVIIDFDKAVEQAMHAVFGEQLQVRYCFYHLTQSTWRKIQRLGLTEEYQTNDEFRLFCGKLDGLALLPLDQVNEGMQHVRNTMPDNAEQLVEYFDRTYVSGQFRQRAVPQQNMNDIAPIRVRHIPPLFKPADWNMHEVTLAGEPRTNNISEGWNNKFSSLVGHQHPTIWKMIECLQAEHARVTGILLQDEAGIRPTKRTKKVYVELQKRLKNLCEDRVAGRKTIAEFLRGVGHNLRGGQPNM